MICLSGAILSALGVAEQGFAEDSSDPADASQLAALDAIRQMIASGDAGEALQRLDALIQQSPRASEPQLLKGVALTRLGRTDEAVEVFKTVSQQHPQLPEPFNNLAVLYA
ncbi:MAG: tetratricopeptide repeat protein, partial [Gammaproteobacteria bacterium]|nr:tetratricopeptide repeat protein [Gammaproteobacteria bacterium]